MKSFIVLIALVGVVACASTNKLAGKYVWDLLKPALTAAEVNTLVGSRDAGYPMYNTIPSTGFSCSSKAQPGFYADQEAQCQVFHRCDQSGNMTSYLCVNQTVFNQITLVCDSWYNVECSRSHDVEDYANSRLYTDLPLFDTPPADYISPSQLVQLQNSGVVTQLIKKPSPAGITASGSASSSSESGSSGKSTRAPLVTSTVA